MALLEDAFEQESNTAGSVLKEQVKEATQAIQVKEQRKVFQETCIQYCLGVLSKELYSNDALIAQFSEAGREALNVLASLQLRNSKNG